MINHLFGMLIMITVAVSWAACNNAGNDSDGDNEDSDSTATTETDSNDSGLDNSDNDSSDDGDTGSGNNGNDANDDSHHDTANGDGAADSDEMTVCERLSTSITRVATKVMLLEDKSLSMDDNNKWTLATSAINGMVTAYESEIQFGLDLFARGTTTTNTQTGGRPGRNNGVSTSCAVGESVIHDVALDNGTVIVNELQNWGPADATPLYLAMENYVDASYAPEFSGGDGNRFLVVISDGKDTCGTEGIFDQQNGASAADLSAVTEELATMGIHTIVIGFGDGVDPNQLNAIAGVGGTSFTQYLQASNGDDLNAALSDIAEKVVVSCEFEVGTFDSSTVNINQVMVSFDGAQIPRDDDCAGNQGWSWKDDAHTIIEFCEAACNQIESESVNEIAVELACSENEVQVIDVE